MAVTESDLDPEVLKMSIIFNARAVSWECGHVTEMLLILKKNDFRPGYSRESLKIWASKEMSHDFARCQSVDETCFSHWGYPHSTPMWNPQQSGGPNNQKTSMNAIILFYRK